MENLAKLESRQFQSLQADLAHCEIKSNANQTWTMKLMLICPLFKPSSIQKASPTLKTTSPHMVPPTFRNKTLVL
jgi:hypothetical protein